MKIPDNAAPTRPYFTRPNDEQPYYNIVDARYQELPLAPYPLAAWAQFNYEGVMVRMGQVVQTARRQVGLGHAAEPADGYAGSFRAYRAAGGHHPSQLKILFAFDAIAHRGRRGSYRDSSTRTAGGLALGAGGRIV